MSILIGVQRDLSQSQWDAVEEDRFEGPTGVRYSRRATRSTRREVGTLIHDGAPLVLHHWAEHRLDWLDGDDALEAWRSVRSAVVSDPARTRSAGPSWTAGLWASPDGDPVVFLTGHC